MKLPRILLLLPVLLLSSCFIPEKFTATLNINKDYSYTFEYDGILTFGPALREIAKNGSLSQKAEDDMRQGTATTFKKEDGFDRAFYEGNGRWKVHCKKTGTIDDTTKLFGEGLAIVTISRAPDGTVSIEGITVDAKIAQKLNAVKCVIDGKLEITTDMAVVRHNATETPKLFGLIGSYAWRISSEKLTSPSMTLKASNSTEADSLLARGNKKAEIRDYDGAIADYNRALELDPKFAFAYFGRGLAQSNKGDHDRAIADYNRAIELDPKLANAYNNRGNAKSDKGDNDGAIADYNRAIELDPKHTYAYAGRGYAKSGKGDYDGAIADCNRAIELDPKHAYAYDGRGNAKRGKGDYDGAMADYNRAIELDPNYAGAYNNRGYAKSGEGDNDGAIADYKRALELDPKNANAVFRYVQLLTKPQIGRFEDALIVAETCLKLDPYNGSVIGLVANLRDAVKRNDEIEKIRKNLQHMEDEVQNNPTNFQAVFNLASAYLSIQQTNRAVAVLERIVQEPRVDPNAVLTAAKAFAQMQNWPKLEMTLERLVKVIPDEPETWYDLAALKVSLGKQAEGLTALTQALELSAKRRQKTANAKDLLATARNDPRFNPLRQLPEFQLLVPP